MSKKKNNLHNRTIQREIKNYKYFIGIDTGKYGAMVAIDSKGKTVDYEDTPYTNGRIDKNKIVVFLKKFNPRDTFIGIEATFDPAKKGTKKGDNKGLYNFDNFSFGRNTMCPEMATHTLGFNYEMIYPMTWKTFFSLVSVKYFGKKNAACMRATNIYKSIDKKPTQIFIQTEMKEEDSILFGKKIVEKKTYWDGRAEAYLVAQYIRQSIQSVSKNGG